MRDLPFPRGSSGISPFARPIILMGQVSGTEIFYRVGLKKGHERLNLYSLEQMWHSPGLLLASL